MRKVKEVIVVEGRYDKNKVCQAVEATVIETSGFQIFSNREKLELLRKLAQKRGLIILTDSDSAGFLIRGHLKGMLGDSIKHAYIPDVTGREKRKRAMSAEGKLGVEGMSAEVIISALERAGATFFEEINQNIIKENITKADMYIIGLTGGPDSAERRSVLLKRLGLPEHMPPNGLLDVLNALYTKEEFFEIAR
jgi:ribonuclease M5